MSNDKASTNLWEERSQFLYICLKKRSLIWIGRVFRMPNKLVRAVLRWPTKETQEVKAQNESSLRTIELTRETCGGPAEMKQ